MEKKKPVVKLLGRDGNAFSILTACRSAAVKAGWTYGEVQDLMTELESGDYNHLLRTAMAHFDVR